MSLIDSLFAAVAMIAAAGVLGLVGRGRGKFARGRFPLIGAVAGLALVAAAIPASERMSGMGMYRTHGWPKPIHGRWSGFEGGERIDWMFANLAVDVIFWMSAALLLLTLVGKVGSLWLGKRSSPAN